MHTRKIDDFDIILKESGIANARGYQYYFARYIFNGINLKNRKLLDVGGGNGIASFFACASEPSCSAKIVDPIDDGSNIRMRNQYNTLKQNFIADNVSYFEGYAHELNEDEYFDIILLHNSINHIGEDLVESILDDPNSRNEYKSRLNKILDHAKSDCVIIISDCANRNLCGDLNIWNPVAPSIEWHLHQQPETWQSLLGEVGLEHVKTTWTSRKEFGSIGGFLFSNKLCAYLLNSHFCSIYRLNR